MAQDVIWQNASEEQLQDAQLAIERSVMNRIFKLAFYPNQDGDILRDQWVLLSDGLSRTIPASPPSLDKLFMRHNIWVVKEKIGPFLTSQSCQPAQKESLCSQRCAESGWRAVYAGLAVVEGTAAALLPFLLLPTLTLQIRTQTSLPWGKPFLACLSGWDALAALPQTRIPFFSTCHHCSFTLESWFLKLAQLTFRARWFFNVGGCPVPCGTCRSWLALAGGTHQPWEPHCLQTLPSARPLGAEPRPVPDHWLVWLFDERPCPPLDGSFRECRNTTLHSSLHQGIKQSVTSDMYFLFIGKDMYLGIKISRSVWHMN